MKRARRMSRKRKRRPKVERKLDPAKLRETSAQLSQWISTEFKGAGLARIALEVEKLTGEAVATAERIARPNYWIRAGIASLLIISVGCIGWGVAHATKQELIGWFDMSKPAAWPICLGIFFLITLEIRWKRDKAIKAVHELRAIAHIIDMHQLGKDSEIEKFRNNPNAFRSKITAYLHACTALLALVSKIGELYVEGFQDSVAVDTVAQFESVCNGLNTKIWQKIIAAEIYRDTHELMEKQECLPNSNGTTPSAPSKTTVASG